MAEIVIDGFTLENEPLNLEETEDSHMPLPLKIACAAQNYLESIKRQNKKADAELAKNPEAGVTKMSLTNIAFFARIKPFDKYGKKVSYMRLTSPADFIGRISEHASPSLITSLALERELDAILKLSVDGSARIAGIYPGKKNAAPDPAK